MRRIEPPPTVKNRWKVEDLLDALPPGKSLELKIIEESSYPYWDKWKYTAAKWSFDAKKLWAIVKTMRRSKEIRFSGKNEFQITITIPSLMQRQLHELDLSLQGSLQPGKLIPDDEKKYYLTSSLMEEAIASSQLEGAATTRKVAREMLENKRKPRNHSEQMIVNNYAGMQWIAAHKDSALTAEFILEIHRIITTNTLGDVKEEGAFRQQDDIHVVDVQTGEPVHIPPGHEKLPALIDAFCRFANDEIKQDFFLHPISAAICVHFLIGYLYPFTDGNGSTARALFYWYLIRKGYWLVEYMSVSRIILSSKAQYARAYQYTELDNMDITYFVLYNLKCILTALEDLKKYVHKKTEEKKAALNLLRDTDLNDRQIAILGEILNDQRILFTVKGAEEIFGVSNQTARNDLLDLTRRGILQTRKAGKQIQFLAVNDAAKKIRSL